MRRITAGICLGVVVSFTGARAELPPKLSETGLYQDINSKQISGLNQGFSPQYPLWTDGAVKRRWIFLPANSVIRTAPSPTTPEGQVVDMDHWEFPVGTKLWKEFSFPKADGAGLKRVETRFLAKISPTKWEFGSYQWDEMETEAALVVAAGKKDVYPTGLGSSHDIPNRASCVRCHSNGGDMPNGFDALQLSANRDPLALHAEPIEAGFVTLESLVQSEKLVPSPNSFSPLIPARDGVGRAAMGYLHSNCGSCHNPGGSANYTELYFRHSLSASSEATAPAFATSINQLTTTYVIPGQNESKRVIPGNPDQSAVFYRLQASDFDRMPPLGSDVNDPKAIELIKRWIQELH